MTTTKTCDNPACGKEIGERQDNITLHEWMYKDGESGPEFDFDNSDCFDFCSMECVKKWAQSL